MSRSNDACSAGVDQRTSTTKARAPGATVAIWTVSSPGALTQHTAPSGDAVLALVVTFLKWCSMMYTGVGGGVGGVVVFGAAGAGAGSDGAVEFSVAEGGASSTFFGSEGSAFG